MLFIFNTTISSIFAVLFDLKNVFNIKLLGLYLICRVKKLTFNIFLYKTIHGNNRKTLQKEGFVYGAPEGIRTPDRSVRSRVLYPAELLARKDGYCISLALKVKQKRKKLKLFTLDNTAKD